LRLQSDLARSTRGQVIRTRKTLVIEKPTAISLVNTAVGCRPAVSPPNCCPGPLPAIMPVYRMVPARVLKNCFSTSLAD